MLSLGSTLQVYDGTAFLKDHPGGAESILLAAGMDSSDDFNAIHSAKAKKMVEDYYIGEFDDTAPSKQCFCIHLKEHGYHVLAAQAGMSDILETIVS